MRLFPQVWIWDWCPTVTAARGEWVTRTTGTRAGLTGSSGVLAVLADSHLRDELDRVAAAFG
jgi:hypothetical protein